MTAAAATTTAVRIGKGTVLHAQMKGVESAWAACGTVSAKFGAARRVEGEVTCQKCIAAAEADAAYEAQVAREAEMAQQDEFDAACDAAVEAAFAAPTAEEVEAEEVHAALYLEDSINQIAAETEVRRYEDQAGLAAVLRVPVEAPAAVETTEVPECMGEFRKGDQVATKDGRVWTVEGPAQNNTTIKLIAADGKSTFRFARNITAA